MKFTPKTDHALDTLLTDLLTKLFKLEEEDVVTDSILTILYERGIQCSTCFSDFDCTDIDIYMDGIVLGLESAMRCVPIFHVKEIGGENQYFWAGTEDELKKFLVEQIQVVDKILGPIERS